MNLESGFLVIGHTRQRWDGGDKGVSMYSDINRFPKAFSVNILAAIGIHWAHFTTKRIIDGDDTSLIFGQSAIDFASGESDKAMSGTIAMHADGRTEVIYVRK